MLLIQQNKIDKVLDNIKRNLKVDENIKVDEIICMLKYIHEHIFEAGLTIDAIKESCQYTNNNITTKFKQLVRKSPHTYIREIRLKAAEILLADDTLSIYMIASAVGYTEEAFSKVFKKTYDHPPLQYRKKKLREMDKKN